MKELVLIRHGDPDHSVNGLTGGWTDSHLTELGRKQAHLTGLRLKKLLGDKAFRFYSSDLSRAVETSNIISASIPVKPVLVDELRELNNGVAANMREEDAKKLELPITEPLEDWVPYPGAENWRMMSERVFSFLDRIAKEAGDTTVIVAHSGNGVSIIRWWLDLFDARDKISFDLDPCSITRLTINSWGERTITKLNDTSHLAELEETK